MLSALTALLLGSCSTAPPPRVLPPAAPSPTVALPPLPGPLDFANRARIVEVTAPLECVIYARRISGISIRGDARTWWDQARNRFDRGQRPELGAVLAFKPAYKSSGHVAVVTDVLAPRLVLVNHADWLNRGRIHENTPVEDISKNGDWSAVRVWHTPSHSWGRRTYPTHGFIYARPLLSADGRGTGM